MGRSPVSLAPLRPTSLGSHTKRLMNIFSPRTATWLGATVVAGAIVKTCGSRSLSCLGMGILAGPFDELAVDEGCSGADQGDQVGCVDGTPAVLGGFDELERHGQARCPRAGALGDLGAVAHGGEGGLDRVGGPQVHPVLGGVVVEGEQLAEVVSDLRDSPGELRPVGRLE